MSGIRRQSLISSAVIYVGFVVGLLNIYLFTKQGIFQKEEFGLYNAFIAVALMMSAFSGLAMPVYLIKFFPYYRAHCPERKNEQFSLALITSLAGFGLVALFGWLGKGLVVQKYGTNAPDLITYYGWLFPLGLGMTLYALLESWAWNFQRSVLTNLLKELIWRLYITALILALYFDWIDFAGFVQAFSMSYLFISLILLSYLLYTGKLYFHFRISRLTKRMRGIIIRLCLFIFFGMTILQLALVFDSLVISSVLQGALAQLAVYSLAQNMAAVIQAPQRGLVSASIPPLALAWKEKNMNEIQRIYQRSSINQLIFATALLALFALDFQEGIEAVGLQSSYLAAFPVILLLGTARLVDMGTGLNTQIIQTSTKWRFELWSGIALLIVTLPSSYWLTKSCGIIGTAIAQLIAITSYNLIRIIFLWKQFSLFPFTRQTPWVLLLGGATYIITRFMTDPLHGWLALFTQSIVFLIIFGISVYYMNLSPDIKPVWDTLKKKLQWR
ncbi:MAG: lipopolysaccharide biosynthesis protein [Bacteroidota bacterium]